MSPIISCGRHPLPREDCSDCRLARLINGACEVDAKDRRIATLERRLAYVLTRWAHQTRDGFGRKAVDGVWSRRHPRARRAERRGK